MNFPSNFKIFNLKAYGNAGELNPKLEERDDRIFVQVELKEPSIGKGTENNITLEFIQKKLVRVEGNVWEVILPTVDRKGEEVESYSVKVVLPDDFDKKLSISKPKPSYIRGNTIYWNDVKDKVVYAVFGSPQYYKVDLRYAVENSKLAPAFVYIAFPPDTLYQKVLVEDIKPAPSAVKIDEDGNYLGKYFLKPKERLEVRFKGYIAVFSQPRDDYLKILPEEFNAQKPYLLRETRYWNLGQNVLSIPDKNLSTREKARLIFDFTVGRLSYDFSKLSQRRIERMGAVKALQNPNQAVCMEFTDLFIALARENGIYAREVQGYGYSQDRRFRPLSLITDVLHAWPEYWDEELKIWVPVDPTWQDTSGIDYFSSLDLNHIVFVIHGKSDTYPLPAGAYKIEDRKDVLVEPVSSFPAEDKRVRFKIERGGVFKEKYLLKGQNEEITIKIKNTGSTFILGKNLKLEGSGLNLSKSNFYILKLAPYQEKEIKVKASAFQEGDAKLILRLGEERLGEVSFKIRPVWYKYFLFIFQNYLYFTIVLVLILLPFILFIARRS